MRRWILALGLAVGFTVLGASAALADGGPHGGYINPISMSGTGSVMNPDTINTDACAGCHRLHTAQSTDKLLRTTSAFQLCADCHNGTGSVLDVMDGKRLSTIASTSPGLGATGGDLNGGGFLNFKGAAVTSKHDVNAGITQAWGAGPAAPGTLGTFNPQYDQDSSGYVAESLDCVSCHNPHGSSNYRLLRDQIDYKNVSVLAYAPDPYSTSGSTVGFTKDEFTRGLDDPTATGADKKYTTAYYGSNGLQAPPNVPSTESGFPDFGVGGYFGTDDGTPTNQHIVDRNAMVTPGSSTLTGVALLCGACHTGYPSRDGTQGSYDTTNGGADVTGSGYSGSTVAYRHVTDHPWNTWDSYDPSWMQNPATSWTATATSGPEKGNTVSSVPLRLASTGAYTNTGASTDDPAQPKFSTSPVNTYGNQEYVTCLTCHNAHGSSAQMTGWAAANAYGSTRPAPSPAQGQVWTTDGILGGTYQSKSILLVADNRAMCEACHQWGVPGKTYTGG